MIIIYDDDMFIIQATGDNVDVCVLYYNISKIKVGSLKRFICESRSERERESEEWSDDTPYMGDPW